MNNKAFTLIELLAVIVVLAIILVISVPRVLDVIEESKKESFRITGETLIKGVNRKIIVDSFTSIEPKTYTITDGAFVGESIKMDGELPDNGTITVLLDGRISMVAEIGDYCIKKDFDNTKVTISKDPNCTVIAPTLESCFGRTLSGSSITITSYSPSCTKDVVIPSVLDGNPVRTIGNNSFFGLDLTSLVIPFGVTTIGDGAFQSNVLTSLSLPQSLESIGAWAFQNSNLTSVIIPPSMTNLSPGIFSGNKLTSVTLPDTLISIGSGALQNNLLTSIEIPPNVTTIENWALHGNLLTSVKIPANISGSVELISYQFNQTYSNNGKLAGTYTSSSQEGTWTKQ